MGQNTRYFQEKTPAKKTIDVVVGLFDDKKMVGNKRDRHYGRNNAMLSKL